MAVLVVELTAFAVAFVVSGALWYPPTRMASGTERRDAHRRDAPLPETVAVALSIEPASTHRQMGADDTGEVAWARHGLRSIRAASNRTAPKPASGRDDVARPSLRELAWSLVAVEGMRRMVSIVLIVVVLFSGVFPFEVPPWELVAVLITSQLLLTLGHYLLSDGLIRPGARLRWSMASVGAGFGDGTSRTGLPIRWTATLATMIALNLAVSLRGLSDRWTHGLGAMPHDERVMTMVAAAWLVGWGFVALRSLSQPELGYYGATRRLEETSTRRLALGATLMVAAVGMVAGVLPGGVPA